jgi:hypothetical protein
MLYILLKGSWLVTLRHIPLQEGGGTLYCAWQDSSMLHTHQLHVAHKLVLNIAARSLALLVHSKISCCGSSFILTCNNFYSVQIESIQEHKMMQTSWGNLCRVPAAVCLIWRQLEDHMRC